MLKKSMNYFYFLFLFLVLLEDYSTSKCSLCYSQIIHDIYLIHKNVSCLHDISKFPSLKWKRVFFKFLHSSIFHNSIIIHYSCSQFCSCLQFIHKTLFLFIHSKASDTSQQTWKMLIKSSWSWQLTRLVKMISALTVA